MGIQDRDYYRNEGPSFLDSLIPSGLVCRWLIGINVAVWCLQMIAFSRAQAAAGDELAQHSAGWVTDWLILDTGKVLDGQIWRLFTFAFLHSVTDFYHILFNMIFLWWFGSDVEQLYGRKEYLAIYLVSAVVGGVAFQVWDMALHPDVHIGRCLGASGAVTTMLILCACHFPHRLIYMFLLLPVPIWFFALFNLAKDVWITLRVPNSGVASIVHLAGAAFAFAYYKWQGSLIGLFSGLAFWKVSRPRSRLKIFQPEKDKEEPVAVSALQVPTSMDEHLEAKLDAVLEKIAKTGKESLTTQEQEILKQAAEMYKRRRS